MEIIMIVSHQSTWYVYQMDIFTRYTLKVRSISIIKYIPVLKLRSTFWYFLKVIYSYIQIKICGIIVPLTIIHEIRSNKHFENIDIFKFLNDKETNDSIPSGKYHLRFILLFLKFYYNYMVFHILPLVLIIS